MTSGLINQKHPLPMPAHKLLFGLATLFGLLGLTLASYAFLANGATGMEIASILLHFLSGTVVFAVLGLPFWLWTRSVEKRRSELENSLSEMTCG